MKNFTQKQSVISRFCFVQCGNWKIKVVQRILILVVLTTWNYSSAQISVSSANIKEVNSFLSGLKNNSVSDYEHLYSLIYDLNPAVYTYDNIIKVYGKKSTVLFTDIASLNTVKSSDFSNNTIEMIRVDIKKNSDLYAKIDLSIFQDFPNLKYIYLYSNVASSENTFNHMFSNYDSKYNLFFSINQGE